MGHVLVLATTVSTLGGLVFGYELGIISGALMQLQSRFHLSCVQQETVVSALIIGAICSSLIGGWLIDRRGRKESILLSNLLVVGGSLVLGVGGSVPVLAAGRSVVGFAMCLSSMSCCIFVSEVVEPKRRGLMVTLYEVGVTAGILLAYAVNYLFFATQEGWRYMFGLAVVPSLAQLLSVWVLPSLHTTVVRLETEPQSPSEQNDGVEEETLNQVQSAKKQYTILQLFHHKDNMCTRTLIGIGLVLFQQFTGQPNVLFYASTIFHSVGFKSDASAVLASVGLGVVKVIATTVAMLCADKVGRRPLLISGCLVMAVGLMLIGFLNRHSVFDAAGQCRSSALNPNGTVIPVGSTELLNVSNNGTSAGYLDASTVPHAAGKWSWLILISMMSVVGAFSVGFGPMTWLVLSEIFPTEVRGRAFALTSCFNWMANLIVTFSFLNVIDVIGLSGTFFVNAVIALVAAVFIHLLLPETKGKSLQNIDKELCERRFPCSDEFCSTFRRSHFSAGYQRLSLRNLTT